MSRTAGTCMQGRTQGRAPLLPPPPPLLSSPPLLSRSPFTLASIVASSVYSFFSVPKAFSHLGEKSNGALACRLFLTGRSQRIFKGWVG